MIIIISGSVGSGKTTISKRIGVNLGFEVVPLNKIAEDFKLNKVKELDTFDFDLDKLLIFIENDIKKSRKEEKNMIYEGHFAHFINPKLVDILFVIGRDLKELKKEYIRRGYSLQKQKDNLEVESFNLCFYEAIEEGYNVEDFDLGFEIKNNEEIKNINMSKKIFLIENNGNLKEIIKKIENIIKERN